MVDMSVNLPSSMTERAMRLSNRSAHIPVFAFGTALSLFFVISYALCILAYLVFPDLAAQHAILALLLPWLKLLSWASFLLGAVESFAFGWYSALVFGSLYNFFAVRNSSNGLAA